MIRDSTYAITVEYLNVYAEKKTTCTVFLLIPDTIPDE